MWKKPLTKQQEAQRLIIEGIQEGIVVEAENKARAIEAGIKDATYEISLSKLKKAGDVKARQDPTKQGRHNILELTLDKKD